MNLKEERKKKTNKANFCGIKEDKTASSNSTVPYKLTRTLILFYCLHSCFRLCRLVVPLCPVRLFFLFCLLSIFTSTFIFFSLLSTSSHLHFFLQGFLFQVKMKCYNSEKEDSNQNTPPPFFFCIHVAASSSLPFLSVISPLTSCFFVRMSLLYC